MEALLRVEHLKKQFHRNSDGTYVLKDISFEMMPGECLGLIGNSGSGKSTIVKILTGITTATKGCIYLEGKQISGKRTQKEIGKKVQMIFQNPKSSLNPKMTIGQNLDDALLYYRKIPKTERKRQCEESFGTCAPSGELSRQISIADQRRGMPESLYCQSTAAASGAVDLRMKQQARWMFRCRRKSWIF